MDARTLTDSERLDWLQLSRTDQVGPITFYRLLERFGSAKEALARLPDLAKRGGRKGPFRAFSRDTAEKEWDALTKQGGQLLCACEDAYSSALAQIDDAPPVLSILGHVSLLQKPAVAMVGARNASLNGRTMAERIARGLGVAGYVVVSGLARGIDSAAHAGSLATGTIACVAGGVDVLYPRENEALYAQIKDQGLLISENALGTEPTAQHFPRRNRLISGLSLGTIVVEASLKSGSLITARMAADQGRDVLAVPGSPLDPRAQGPNALLKDGAILVEKAEDAIAHLTTFRRNRLSEPQHSVYSREKEIHPMDTAALDSARDEIRSLLTHNAVAIDDLIRQTEFQPAIVQTVLLELELAGAAQRLAGNRIVLIEQEVAA